VLALEMHHKILGVHIPIMPIQWKVSYLSEVRVL